MTIRPFAEVLQSGKFLVTAELNPPKGTNLETLLDHAEQLRAMVDAFNLTDSHSSRMTMAPLAVARLLVERGINPMLQVTCRDRNRLALQSDLLGAYALGVRNIVCMTGDPPEAGDHPDTKPVFDLEVLGLLEAVAALQAGQDLGGHPLTGTPTFCVGAVVNPGAPDRQKELRRMEDKVARGAQFSRPRRSMTRRPSRSLWTTCGTMTSPYWPVSSCCALATWPAGCTSHCPVSRYQTT